MLSMVIYGLVESGSPWDTRGRRFDDSRVSDLTSLKYAIQTYYSTHSALPSNLDALKADQPYSNSQWIDPETKQNYEYNVNGTTSFQLFTLHQALIIYLLIQKAIIVMIYRQSLPLFILKLTLILLQLLHQHQK
jgi:hypothetical protein